MPRRLGQHFLFNADILHRIALAVCPEAEPLVVEIGPGPGGLTEHLAERADRVVAIELDPALASGLRNRFPGVEVLDGDILQTDLTQWGPLAIAGNLPYYITSPIIDRVLALGPLLKRAVFLVQKEVAERLAAGPGSRDYGYLTVATQVRCRVEQLFTVKPGAFRPPPKVDSAVVRLTPHAQPAVADLKDFLWFAGRCFAQKRKMLRSNLAPIYGRAWIDAQAEASRRAEQMSIAELAGLFGRAPARTSILVDS
jgi:16S rRNA (adenine1518-N6/adenine1519-N6)-dimethyltransferase